MKKKSILIDASLTGGRGPAKQAYEFATACLEKNIPYILLTNRSFAYKLADLSLKPDIILDIELSDEKERIYELFNKTLSEINFDLLVKFGARTASTYTASRLNKPFVVVDGGLPDKLEEFPSLYAKEGYNKAEKYILTTHFPWMFPQNLTMTNISLGTYPFSKKTISFTRKLRTSSRTDLINRVKISIPETASKNYDMLVNLLITGDYAMEESRKTYGAWLTAREYDAVVGFIRRFVTDLGVQYKGKALVYMDSFLYPIVDDIKKKYKNISFCTNRNKWSYDTEIVMQRLSDIVVSRATNYIPNLAMCGQGGLITTPVPADGYMNEDTAGYQALALGITELISYDDEDYMKKFLLFAKDKKKQKQISKKLVAISEDMIERRNAVDLILEKF